MSEWRTHDPGEQTPLTRKRSKTIWRLVPDRKMTDRKSSASRTIANKSLSAKQASRKRSKAKKGRHWAYGMSGLCMSGIKKIHSHSWSRCFWSMEGDRTCRRETISMSSSRCTVGLVRGRNAGLLSLRQFVGADEKRRALYKS